MLEGTTLLETNSGAVAFTGDMLAGSRLMVQSGTGDVTLTLPYGRQVQLQLHGEPGKIHNAWGSVTSSQQAQPQATVVTHGGSIALQRGS